MKKLIFILLAGTVLTACAPTNTSSVAPSDAAVSSSSAKASVVQATSSADNLKHAYFAGGCFWCVEADFEKLDGVIEAISGYTGGRTENPTYTSVTRYETGHYEAVKVSYDASVVSYTELLDYFWRHIDPTDPNGQFCDKGSSYRTAVFADESQLAIAEKSKNDIAVSKPFDGPVTTEILPLGHFTIAEEYHQDFYKKKPVHYARYRNGCRRDARLKQLWGDSKPSGSNVPVETSGSYGSGK